MSFVMRATGGACAADRIEIRRALSLLIDPGQTFELRGLPSGRSKVCRGSDLDAAVDAAWDLSDGQVYYTLNPCRPDLDKAAANRDILVRRWLFIDCDPIRPADVSATDAEKGHAIDLAARVADHLSSLGWPDPVWIDSGNGVHLLYRIDLPADKLSQQLVKGVLVALADRFDFPGARVDRSIHNAARIAKLPGTWARKGVQSDDRPHRMARLVSAPPTPEIVPVGSLQALAEPAPKSAVNGHHPNPWAATTTAGTLEGYVRSAVGRECARVAMTPAGDRNNALNTAAFNLGTMSDWSEMLLLPARAELLAAALHAGLGDLESRKTIESGWTAGAAKGRARPVSPHVTGKASSQSKAVPARLTTGLDEVKPEKVDWLWENIIAVGFISIFAGRTGLGKSFVLCDVASRLSRGEPAPYSALKRGPLRTVIISEDPVNVMLGPRLIELGADRKSIRFMTWEAMGLFTLDNIAMLDQLYEECGHPGLLVIDPPTNFLGDVDEHKNSEVRQALMALVAWLSQKRVACVMVTHVNKAVGKGLDAVERIVGSVAWGSVARVTIAFAKDPDNPGQLLCGGTKNNLGEIADPLSFRIVKTDVLARIEWLGKSQSTMEDAMNQLKKKSRGANAVEWLEGLFCQRREWESDELRRMAREVGVSKYALFESAEVLALPIKKRKRINSNGEQYWVWIAEGGWPSESTESSEPCDVNSEIVRDSRDSDRKDAKAAINGMFRMSPREDSEGPVLSDDSDRESGPES